MKTSDTFPNYPLDYLLEETVEFFEKNDQFFRLRELIQLHYKSTLLLDTILQKLDSKSVTCKEAQYIFLKWLCTITVRAPKYLIAINGAINNDNFGVDEGLYMLQRIIVDCGFLEIAYQTLDRNDSPIEETSINTAKDYMNAQHQQDLRKKGNIKKRSFHHVMSTKQIDTLYEQLISNKHIDSSTSLATFRDLFSANTVKLQVPIKWLSSTVLLAFLLHKLDTRYELINDKWQTHFGEKRQAFISKKNVLISASSLSTYVSSILKEEHPERLATYHKKLTPILESVKSVKD